jgi:hypothetical protein
LLTTNINPTTEEVIRMEKECCQANVTELDDGYRIEITGKDIKEKGNCWELIEKCCKERQKAGGSDDCC